MNNPKVLLVDDAPEEGRAVSVGCDALVLLPGAKAKARLKNLRGLVRYWKTEAREWRRLYEKQRGGESFDAIQSELATARQRIRSLEQNVASETRGPMAPNAENGQSPRCL